MSSKSLIAVLIFLLSFIGFVFYPDTWGEPDFGEEVVEVETELPGPSLEEALLLDDHIKVATWNLLNFGESKNTLEIQYIASTMSVFDIVAVQEVSTSFYGPKAVGKLLDALNRSGSKWDAVYSDPTTGAGTERYAFFWKTSKLKKSGRAWLVKPLEEIMDREPFMCRFENKQGEKVLLANFHAIPSSKNPEREVEQLVKLHQLYKEDNLVILGDFNVEQYREAFYPLKSLGYLPVLRDQKTSLKRKIDNGEYLSREHDNIFIEHKHLRNGGAGVIDFVPEFENLTEAAKISDHLPVWMALGWH